MKWAVLFSLTKSMEETYRWYCLRIVQRYRLGFKSVQIVEFGGIYRIILFYLLLSSFCYCSHVWRGIHVTIHVKPAPDRQNGYGNCIPFMGLTNTILTSQLMRVHVSCGVGLDHDLMYILWNIILLCQCPLKMVDHSAQHSRYKCCLPAGPTRLWSCRPDSKVTGLGVTGWHKNWTLNTRDSEIATSCVIYSSKLKKTHQLLTSCVLGTYLKISHEQKHQWWNPIPVLRDPYGSWPVVPGTHKEVNNFVSLKNSWYITVMNNMIVHTEQQLQW